MNRISACIVTLNEQRNLPRVLNSLQDLADEVVLVDSGSSDQTVAIAGERGACVYARPWTNYGDQKNFAAESATHAWILSLDADEELSPELRESLLAWKSTEPQFTVYEMARRAHYLGAWIRHSGWYPDYQRRLYRRDVARFEGVVHEALRFPGEVGRLQGDLLHYTMDSFAEHERKVECYTDLAARQMYAAGMRSWRPAMWFATLWSWFQNFILRGGFLDGYRGALIARMAARSVRLKYKKLGRILAESAATASR